MKIFMKAPVFAVCLKGIYYYFFLGRKMEAGNFVRGKKSKNTELKKNM